MGYCVYVTIYSGNQLPPFYIGYTSILNIKKGYKGSPRSRHYVKIWKEEIKQHSNLFKTIIISLCKNKQEAINREIQIQKHLNVVKNPLYSNKAIFPHRDTTGYKFTKQQKKNLSI